MGAALDAPKLTKYIGKLSALTFKLFFSNGTEIHFPNHSLDWLRGGAVQHAQGSRSFGAIAQQNLDTRTLAGCWFETCLVSFRKAAVFRTLGHTWKLLSSHNLMGDLETLFKFQSLRFQGNQPFASE